MHNLRQVQCQPCMFQPVLAVRDLSTRVQAPAPVQTQATTIATNPCKAGEKGSKTKPYVILRFSVITHVWFKTLKER